MGGPWTLIWLVATCAGIWATHWFVVAVVVKFEFMTNIFKCISLSFFFFFPLKKADF